jgi:hypothetical protein
MVQGRNTPVMAPTVYHKGVGRENRYRLCYVPHAPLGMDFEMAQEMRRGR